jgi:hypothetical protein
VCDVETKNKLRLELGMANRQSSLRKDFGHKLSTAQPPSLRAASHYGRPSREAVGLSGQIVLRVQRNGLEIHS